MEFKKRKAAALAAMNSPAPDKSPKGSVDTPIIPLLNAINAHPSYFTTSSCSGRISVLSQPVSSPITPKKKAGGGSWLFISHDPVQSSSLIPLLFPSPAAAADRAPSNELEHLELSIVHSVVFRFEPLIIAVECKDIEAAQSLVSLAISSGFRESGITSANKRIIIAIRCSIRMEVPLGDTRRLMVSPDYVEYLVEVANGKFGINRKRTDLFLDKLIKNGFSGQQIGMNGGLDHNDSETCEEIILETLEGELGPESNEDIKTDDGSSVIFHINLSVVEVSGEPVEKLFFWGHSACTLGKKQIAVFGGFGGIGRHSRRNDLLILDTESGIVETIGAPVLLSPRLGHTSSIVEDSMYIIGGRADPQNILNDVWLFNTSEKEWKLLQCSGKIFPPRHRHAAAVVGSKIYVYGGIHNDAILSSLYMLDTRTSEWAEVEMKGDLPGPRHSHSLEATGFKLYIFGGHDGEKALGDLYSFDIRTGLCVQIKANGKSPNARFSHMMFIYLNYLGILGGCPVSGQPELFLLDLHCNSWKNVMLKSIEEILFVRSTANVVGGDLIIIGGGAACYAFGTKFSEPVKMNLLQLMSLHDNAASKAAGLKNENCQRQENGGALLPSVSSTEQKIVAYCGQESETETNALAYDNVVDPRINFNGLLMVTPFALRIAKEHAKLGKDILKFFGWLDLVRKVYTLEGGMHVCFPVTETFCTMLDKHCLGDIREDLNDFNSMKHYFSRTKLADVSILEALNFLLACGATKIVDAVAKVKKSPNSPFKVMKETVDALLNHHGLSSELLEQLPPRWERLGDILVLPVSSFTDPAWDSIGEELWPLVAQSLGTQRLARQGRVAQTGTRDSKLEMLVGDDGWVEHRENGILYSFDATKCMFSWGNLSEKLRMGCLDCTGQVVVDLFAGIGYFVLPFLVRANAKRVYACEWNPHAIEALHRNLSVNSVADRCVVIEGDNRVMAPKGVADRVCLGLLPSSESSWITAVRALRDDGGILHIHGNVKDTEVGIWTNHVVQSIFDIAKSEGHMWDVSVEHVERVKWYAPHIRHLVADLRCKCKRRSEQAAG